MMIKRLQALVAFMTAAAEQGQLQFQQNLDQGHHHGYRNDIDYLRTHAPVITAGIMELL